MRNTTVGFMVFALAAGGSVGWYGGRSQLAAERVDVRQELISQLGRDQELMKICFSDLRNQFTPGYKSNQVRVDPSHPTISMEQGQLFATQSPSHLAIQGEGFFLLQTSAGRRYTRDGRFSFMDGTVASSAGTLMGYELDASGIAHGELVPLEVPLEPLTKLYDGVYTGLRFNVEGKLYGLLDGGEVPLYQVALATFANPHLLDRAGLTSFEETEAAAVTRTGVVGSRGFGAIAPGYLEMSNVDDLEQSLIIGALREHSGLLIACPGSPTPTLQGRSAPMSTSCPASAPLPLNTSPYPSSAAAISQDADLVGAPMP